MPILALALLLSIGLIVTACDKREEGEPERPLVITSIWPLGSLIRNIAGTRAQVETLTPYGHPHVARSIGEGDRNLAKFASVGFFSGLGYDNALAAELRKVVRGDVPIVFLGSESITPEALISYRAPDDSTDVINPFTWTDPIFGRSYAEKIRSELTRVDPAGAKDYEQNYEKVVAALDRLDSAISETISTIPTSARSVFAEVNAFDYLMRRYRMSTAGSVEVFTGQDPNGLSRSSQSVSELGQMVKDSGAPSVFATQARITAEITEIAKIAGVRSIGLLRYEALPGPPGSLGYTYFGMLIDNARNLAGHLGGSTSPLDDVRPNDVVTT